MSDEVGMRSSHGTLHRVDPGSEQSAGVNGDIRVARARCNRFNIVLASDNPPMKRRCSICFPAGVTKETP